MERSNNSEIAEIKIKSALLIITKSCEILSSALEEAHGKAVDEDRVKTQTAQIKQAATDIEVLSGQYLRQRSREQGTYKDDRLKRVESELAQIQEFLRMKYDEDAKNEKYVVSKDMKAFLEGFPYLDYSDIEMECMDLYMGFKTGIQMRAEDIAKKIGMNADEVQDIIDTALAKVINDRRSNEEKK